MVSQGSPNDGVRGQTCSLLDISVGHNALEHSQAQRKGLKSVQLSLTLVNAH